MVVVQQSDPATHDLPVSCCWLPLVITISILAVWVRFYLAIFASRIVVKEARFVDFCTFECKTVVMPNDTRKG